MNEAVPLPPDGDRDGTTYASCDYGRLNKQAAAVWRVMLDGRWRSLRSISALTGYGEASISARLRDFRKAKFGAHVVDRERLASGMFLYRLILKKDDIT